MVAGPGKRWVQRLADRPQPLKAKVDGRRWMVDDASGRWWCARCVCVPEKGKAT